MVAAAVPILAGYGGGGGDGSAGGYSAMYWVVVAAVAVLVLSLVSWGVKRFKGRDRVT